MRPFTFVAAAALLASSTAFANEGQWRPAQIAELDKKRLETMGLELAPGDLWTPGRGGLLQAAVNYDGCSAGFVSETGLIVTNHHCAYGAIQAQSSVENDYLKDGFLAKRREDELVARGRSSIFVLQKIVDVTAEVRAVADAAKDDLERYVSVERKKKALVDECEEDKTLRCRVASFHHGARFERFEFLHLKDIRIVYAPPGSIGEYGGEIDNWMWPRHTGDFTILRAYVGPDGKPAEHSAENVPYRPKQFFRIDGKGVSPGDFVAIAGYPGHTNRHLVAVEIERQISQVLPGIVDLYGEWIDILGTQAKRSKAIAIKVAAHKRSLANRHKNARGMLAGIERMKLTERRKREEASLGTSATLDALRQLSAERRKTHDRDFLLANVGRSANVLAIAVDLVRRTRASKKPDLDRRAAYMTRNEKRLWRRFERRLRDFDPKVDEALLTSFLKRFDKKLAPRARNMIRRSKLSKPATAKALFDTPDPKKLAKSRDPLIVVARRIADEIEAMEERSDRRAGRMLALAPDYVKVMAKRVNGPLYPDANGTLRFSYATVRGYSPQDGIVAFPQTRLAGVVAKHTGEDPFDVPDRILQAAERGETSRFADSLLQDVPVCFLSDGDTTGGNSGSPVIDGRGRLVGLNFDRVWENIAGDFGYTVERSRNISVDVRYLAFVLEEVERAKALLKELGL